MTPEPNNGLLTGVRVIDLTAARIKRPIVKLQSFG
mgnify:CR=1 FL=1